MIKKFIALFAVSVLLAQPAFASRPQLGGTSQVTVSSVLNAGNTGSTILASHGAVYSIHISNQHAATSFWVKFYNLALPPASTDTPVLRLFVKAQTTRELEFPKGINFSTGIGVRCVSEAADNGTTGASTNECTVNTTYGQ